MKKLVLFLLCFFALSAAAQVTTDPAILQQGYTGPVTLTFDPSQGDKGMMNATECYLYSCVEVNNSGKWEYQLANWPSKSEKTKMTKSGSKWVLNIPNLYTFYGVPTSKTITKLLVLFTNGDSENTMSGRAVGGADIIIDVVEPGLVVAFSTKLEDLSSQGSSVTITCNATESASMTLKHNGATVKTGTGTEMTYTATFTEAGTNLFELSGTNGSKTSTATMTTYVAAAPTKENRPAGIVNGIYYPADPSKVTLCTYAGSKTAPAKHVFVVGDFNNWEISNDYQLKQANDSAYFWIELKGLTPKKEYAFQYVVMRPDGVVKRICDLYSEKVLTWDDQWEPKTSDPTLMPYPSKADGSFVTVIQTAKDAFQWSDATLNFQRPNKNNLVIYELWVYDYSGARNLHGLSERLDYLQQLGVNAIELMPMCEFDGNYNWGYSPCLYFALDKAYGTPKQYKEFIDECHKRGMAVIMDMVFNHATGNNPMNKLYPKTSDDASTNELRFNPWFNVNAPHPDNVYEDWNHDFSPAHQMFIRALQYWLREYKVDGYRLDLSHGLCGTSYNAVANLKDYYAKGVKSVTPDAYMILEHWGDYMSSDRPKLISEGMQCWANNSFAYLQTAMGWLKPDDDGHTDAFNESNQDNYISYCESHDEERMQYKAKMWGAGNIAKDLSTRINRVPENLVLNALLNGSHMIWQFSEIGYDYSINCDVEHPNASDSKYRCNVKPRPEPNGYFREPSRVAAYVKCAQAFQLRTRILPQVFEGNPTAATLGSTVIVRSVQWGSDVYVVANFDPSATQTVTLPSGTWYDYYAGGSQAPANIQLAAGEIKIFTGQQVALPEINTDLESLLAVENIFSNDAPKAIKILRDGQVLILRGDQVYDLMGRRIQ